MVETLIKRLPDTAEDRSFAPTFFVFSVFMAMGGLVWGLICTYFQLLLPSSIPFGYVVFTVINLWIWFKKPNWFASVRLVQVFLSLLLPFLFQWMLGGFHPTGVVMIWSVLALIGLLTFYQAHQVWGWGGLFLLLTIISVRYEQTFSVFTPSGLRDGSGSLVLMGINFGMVSLMLFLLGRYVILLQRRSLQQIQQKNQALRESEQEREMAYQELLAQEEEIRQNAEELMVSNEQLHAAQQQLNKALNSEKAAKRQLEAAKDTEIAKQNQKITQSIRYAQRIQRAMLPSREDFHQAFPNAFIYYQPRDIVSGDVYWSYAKGNKHIVAAVDCTGHGVPGAILSMIAFEQLVEIVNLYQITEPDLVLKTMHEAVCAILKQDSGEVKDGMDVALCCYDSEERVLRFAGANRPLFYVKNGEGHLIKGDKFSIGGVNPGEQGREFRSHAIAVDAPISFYLFSDGYQDQFGGPDGRKFMAKKMRRLLQEVSTKPVSEQAEILEEVMKDWMGDQRQIDDILVIGVKLNPDQPSVS